MEVLREKEDMRNWSRRMRRAGYTVALVPTMGFLHPGHLSLVQHAKQLADVVVVSIYVNPSQFAPTEDFGSYPRDVHGDLAKLQCVKIGNSDGFCALCLALCNGGRGEGPSLVSVISCVLQPFKVDAIFNPVDLYVRDSVQRGAVPENIMAFPDKSDDVRERNSKAHTSGQGHETWVRVEKLEVPMCGQSRPGFFRGVATVVTKLFNIVEPDVAIFGKKDYQQWHIIKRMVRDLDFAINIVGCEILREEDGLAMSSRNVYLSSVERVQALSINKSLRQVEEAVMNGIVDTSSLIGLVQEAITSASGRVDYVQISEQESLHPLGVINCPSVLCVAAWFGSVRLIDNIELQPPQSR